jgi:hypothetical protein
VRQGKEARHHGEYDLANTDAWKAARGRLTGGRVSARKGSGEGMVRAKRRSAGGVGVVTVGGGQPLIGWRRGGGGRVPSMAGVEGASMPRIEGTGYRGLKRGKGAA